MKKSIKIILIISLTINFIFIISSTVIGFKAWNFKRHYLGDHHYSDHDKARKKKHTHSSIFYFIKDNEKIREKLRGLRDLRREAKKIVKDKEQPISLEEIKSLLERLESEVIALTQLTHQEIYAELENMSEEEREKTLDFLFKRK